jgi:hypothetical protein
VPGRLVALCCLGRGLSAQSCTCTVAILAQGTSWAVAVTQAFFVAPCIVVAWLRLVGLVLRFGVAARCRVVDARQPARVCYDLVAAVGCVWGIVVCVVAPCFAGCCAAGRLVKLAAVDVGSRSQAGCLKRNTAMDDSIGGS